MKEKLIGQTLEIKPDTKNVLQSFLQNIKNQDIKKYITTNQSTLIKIFNLSKNNNLRSFKIAFFNFERLLPYMKDIKLENKKYIAIFDVIIRDILLKITAITLKYKNGNIAHPSYIKNIRVPVNEMTNEEFIERYNNKGPDNFEDNFVKKYENSKNPTRVMPH